MFSENENNMNLPQAKQTTLGLYLTAQEAYEKWKASPDQIKILDVRTFDEYVNIGHPDMAWNIPVFFLTGQWDQEKKQFAIAPNPEFIDEVRQICKPDDTIYVMCRSGGRSAWAVNRLAEAGFTRVYNITDGMEGDKVSDPESVYNGKRIKNGWKNSGVPWTYACNPKHMVLHA